MLKKVKKLFKSPSSDEITWLIEHDVELASSTRRNTSYGSFSPCIKFLKNTFLPSSYQVTSERQFCDILKLSYRIEILDCAPCDEFNRCRNLHGVKTKMAIKSDDENIQCIAAAENWVKDGKIFAILIKKMHILNIYRKSHSNSGGRPPW